MSDPNDSPQPEADRSASPGRRSSGGTFMVWTVILVLTLLVAVWLGWNEHALPLQLRTGENVLRVAYCRNDAPDNGMAFLTVPGFDGALRVGIPNSVFHLPATPTW